MPGAHYYCRVRKERLELAPPDPHTPAGGEGVVHDVVGHPGTVAKIYRDPAAHERRAKVEALVANPFAEAPAPDGWRRFAMPDGVLVDPSTGAFAGYTMPRIAHAAALDEFFHPRGRRYHRDAAATRVALALAVAELLDEVQRHSLLLVLGDLKPPNILADDQGRAALIDLDSAQLTTLRGTTYLSRVFTPGYVAPELLGRDLDRVRREPSSDLFALAVILFQIVMRGWHPYAGVRVGGGRAGGREPLEARIRAGAWPYAPGTGYAPPPEAPALPAALRPLFTRAFVAGHAHPAARPTPAEWADAFGAFREALSRGRATVAVGGAAARPRSPRIRRFGLPLAACLFLALSLGVLGMAGHAGRPARVRYGRPGATSGLLAARAPWPLRGVPGRRFRGMPHRPDGVPPYWRRLRDGGGRPLCFESSVPFHDFHTRRRP